MQAYGPISESVKQSYKTLLLNIMCYIICKGYGNLDARQNKLSSSMFVECLFCLVGRASF